MMPLKIIILFFLAVVVLLSLSCEQDEVVLSPQPPPPDVRKPLQLTADFAESQSLWLRIAGGKSGDMLILKRSNNTSTITDTMFVDSTIAAKDSLIIDEPLVPNAVYSYKLFAYSNNILKDSVGPLMMQTLDTTSHNFTWTTDTFGVGGSELMDIWGTDETHVWAVGKITTRQDSSWAYTYGIIYYDGVKWTPQKVKSVFQGVNYDWYPLHGITGFSENDIWITSGIPLHWDGSTWTSYDIASLYPPNGRVITFWGTSSNNLFAGGFGGTMLHFDGENWSRMELPTTWVVYDIFGVDSADVYATCLDYNSSAATLLHFDGKEWKEIWQDLILPGGLLLNNRWAGVWGLRRERIYLATGNVYQNTMGHWIKCLDDESYQISGTAPNDFIVAARNVYHWNGSTWAQFPNLGDNGYRRKLIGKDIFIVGGLASGGIGTQAFIRHGKRQ